MNVFTSRQPSSSRIGFTLVELLTVIAIIGILAAILIPVVGTVRQSARSASAAVTLRDLGNGLRLYCNDNKNILPGPIWSGSNYAGYVYDNSTSSTNGRNLCRYLQPYLLIPASQNGAWLEAPSFKPDTFVATNPTGSRAYQYAYKINYNEDGSIDPDATQNPFAGSRWKFTRISNPSKSWFIKDLDKLNLPPNAAPGGSYISATPFNGKVRNVLFFDGHVATEKVN